MPMSPKEMLTLLKENGFETVNQNGLMKLQSVKTLTFLRSCRKH